MTEAKRRVADVLEDVAGGEGVTVTRRGRAMFEFAPGHRVVQHRRGNAAKLKALVAQVKHTTVKKRKPGEKSAAAIRQEVRDRCA